MKLVNGNITFFTSNDVADKEEFFRQMDIMLRDSAPSYVWVDNYTASYRFWNFSVLFIENEKIISDTYFDMGSYSITLIKGSVMQKTDAGFNISGGFVFRHEGYISEGKSLQFCDDGKFIFNCLVSSPDDLDMGIRYFSSYYDDFTQRTILVSVRSPFIKINKFCDVTINFYPFVKNECRAFFKDTVSFESFYTTIYGDKISFFLDGDFYFVLEQSYSSAGGQNYYFTPAGTVNAKAESAKESIEFMPGLSGSEYIRVKKEFRINFVPGQKALFEEFYDIEKEQYPLTSYLSFPEGDYFSQPRRGGFYRQEGKVYDFTELIPVSLKEVVIPSFAYSGAENTDESIISLENDHISPLRHEIIENLFYDVNKFSPLAAETPLKAVTRHGMKISINAGRAQWFRLANANIADPGLAFTYPSQKLQIGLEAANLFMVLYDPDQIAAHAKTPYRITKEALNIAERNGYKDAGKLRALCDSYYYSYDEWEKTLKSKTAVINGIIQNACDNWIVNAGGWWFNASPRFWNDYGTVMIIKMDTNKSLMELLQQPQVWSFPPEDGKKDPYKIIKDIEDKAEQPKNSMLDIILNSPEWRGTVIFNCGMDLTFLPEELKFMANGINKSEFKAAFLAFPVSTADDAGENNLSALADYRDVIDQYYQDFREYAFKVLMIQIRIINNKVESFQCKAELLINKFFGGRAISYNSESGNNLIFNGTYQEDESGGHYNFMLDNPVKYSVSGSGITEMTITDGALRTDSFSSRFVLDGTAKLYLIEECDIFSYDALRYSGFSVEMFQKDSGYSFKTNIDAMTLNTSVSKLRETSFAAGFPVLPVAIQTFKAKTPKDSGYTALQIKGVVPEKMDKECYGILWEVKMGNLGDLAAKINMTLDLVTAWSPTPERENQDYTGNFAASKPKIFAGIRFGAAGSSDDWNLPLQGILRLGFDSIDLSKTVKDDKASYFFRFRNFGVTIFEIRFPSTNNDMYLISNEKKSLGWYGSAGK